MTDDVNFTVTPGFLQILERIGSTLAVSIYVENRVLLISAQAGRLKIHASIFERPMGIAGRVDDDGVSLAIATYNETVVLRDEPKLAASLPDREGEFKHLFVPRALFLTGDVDGHDLVWIKDKLLFANTRFSCIAAPSERHSFVPVWQPPFVSQIMPEDRCHLNGIAGAEDRIAYVSALGRSDTRRGWSEGRGMGGVVLEVPSGDVVLQGLSVPHSPRLFGDDLYVLESGRGAVLRADPATGRASCLAELPGFTRGLDRHGDVLFVGLSKIRESAPIKLPIQGKHDTLVCGIAAVERKEGRLLGWLKFEDSYSEIFDVKVLPAFSDGAILSLADDGYRRALVLPGRAFWAQDTKTQ